MDLKGRRALVTGGASGIGAATCRRLSELGADVTVVDVAVDAGMSLAAELGGRFVCFDVSSGEAWAEFVASSGPFDVAHLNAGVATRPRGYPLLDDPWPWVTEEAYRRVLGVNCGGVFFGITALVPQMARRGGGNIVVTASIGGMISQPDDPIYAMSKHAVIGLVRGLGPVVAEKGVTLTAVCPGGTDTPLVPADARAIPNLRLSPPRYIANAVIHALTVGEPGQIFIAFQEGQPYWPYTWPDVTTAFPPD
jgi:NAD(P)-dependent dehydrogenase (short-subunit alcohol dehydrogenase family)